MGANVSCPYYLTNNDLFMNGSNIVAAPFGNITTAFTAPVSNHSTTINGFNWTQPFPGTSVSGHAIDLVVSKEMPILPDIIQNATTVLSSLSFGLPAGMVSATVPAPMDPSWYMCRHVFISTKPEVKAAVDGGKGCSFLPSTCQTDLVNSLTQNWGKLDPIYMCSTLAFDSIPASCVDSFGSARQDVMNFNSTFLANSTLAQAQTDRFQSDYTWRMGTDYHDPGDPTAYAIAANRTFMVATVWGYSSRVNPKSIKVPPVSLACLSSGKAYVPPPPPPSNTTSSSLSSSATTHTTTQTTTKTSSTIKATSTSKA